MATGPSLCKRSKTKKFIAAVLEDQHHHVPPADAEALEIEAVRFVSRFMSARTGSRRPGHPSTAAPSVGFLRRIGIHHVRQIEIRGDAG